MNAPNSKLLSKNNAIIPFDDVSSLEFLATKNDCTLFAMGSHNKKRPNNLIVGRTFDQQMLDMVELEISHFKSLKEYAGAPKKRIGSKPMMLFLGDTWHLDETYSKLQNLMIDFFRGQPMSKIALSGIDHIITFAATELGIVHMRTYYVKLKKNPSGGKDPLPHLTPCGPDMDMKLRRTQFAAAELWKAAMKQPKQNKVKKQKNQSTNVFGEKIGKLHLEKQNLDHIRGKRSKALRVASKLEAEEERATLDDDLKHEKEELNMEFQQTHGFAASSWQSCLQFESYMYLLRNTKPRLNSF